MVRQLDLTDLSAFSRAGECTFLVSEEFTFHQGLRDRRAVYRNEGFGTPGTRRVDQTGKHLLTGSALSRDKNI